MLSISLLRQGQLYTKEGEDECKGSLHPENSCWRGYKKSPNTACGDTVKNKNKKGHAHEYPTEEKHLNYNRRYDSGGNKLGEKSQKEY